MMLNAPESLSATEQDTEIESVGCNITFPPDNNSNEDPTGIGASLSYTAVVLSLDPPPVPAPILFV